MKDSQKNSGGRVSIEHIPVMLHEVMAGLDLQEDGCYIDATFGRGGHAQAILQALGPEGRLWVMDRDPAAIAEAKAQFATESRVSVVAGPFSQLSQLVPQLAPQAIAGRPAGFSGIFFDLGVSSPQLDDAARGFSFMHDGPLDMRMDPTLGESAAQYVMHVGEKELADVLFHYGEERYSRRIARAIVAARQQAAITRTTQLAEIIKQAHPAWSRQQHPATRSFQALRIMINQELTEIETALAAAVDMLAPGGRLVVISFHSLEDRIVKHFIRRQAGDALPSGLPDPDAPRQPRLKKCGGLQRPTEQELQANTRSRSARMRVARKL